MKRTIAFTFGLILLLLSYGCGGLSKAPIEYGDLGTFEYAEYDTYNSPAEENGLGGAKVFLDGRIDDMMVQDDYSFATFFDGGKKWLLCWGMGDNYLLSVDGELLKTLQGNEYRAFGYYMGYSDAFNAPAITVIRCTDMKTGISYSMRDFDGNFEVWSRAFEKGAKNS